MKHFLALYMGSMDGPARDRWNALDDAARAQRDAEGMAAWMAWGQKYADAIVDNGAPLGKTKRADPSGVADMKNLVTGYVIVRADSHEAAARMFEQHPHFANFPGDSVEIMECLPMPEMPK